jgi:hypothetical protein
MESASSQTIVSADTRGSLFLVIVGKTVTVLDGNRRELAHTGETENELRPA